MKNLKLLIAFGSFFLVVFVSSKLKSKSFKTQESKVSVVIIMDENVKIVQDILLYHSSSDVEKMSKKFPENSRFYEGSITNLNPDEGLTTLLLEIYADGQFIPGDMFVPGNDFLRGDVRKIFRNKIVVSEEVMQSLTGKRTAPIAIDEIENIEVERSKSTVKVFVTKPIDKA